MFYLINITLGFFAIGYVPGMLLSNNVHTTAQNLLEHEQLYRFGLVAHIIILLTNFPLAAIIPRKLFKPVNKSVALLVVLLTVVATAIEASNILNQFMPLVIAGNKQFMADFNAAQLDSLAFMFHRLQDVGVNLAFAFFGFYGMCTGYLIFKSTFLPKIIGVFMAIGGACYAFSSFTSFLAPELSPRLFPYIQIPSGLAQLTLCLWFLIAAVNAKKWEEKMQISKAGEARGRGEVVRSPWPGSNSSRNQMRCWANDSGGGVARAARRQRSAFRSVAARWDPRAIAATRPATVGASNRARSGSSTPSRRGAGRRAGWPAANGRRARRSRRCTPTRRRRAARPRRSATAPPSALRGGDEGACGALPRAGAGSARRSSLPLGRQGQRREHDEGRRHHVVGQPSRQVRAQRRGPGSRLPRGTT